MKKLLRSLSHQMGFEPLHYSSDPLLQSLLNLYNVLRLNPEDQNRWVHLPPRLSSVVYLKQLLRVQKIDLLLDIGANSGQFALEARRAGYQGEIISFEPLAGHQESLKVLASRDRAWRVLPYALGSTSAEMQLNVYEDDTFSSFHEINEDAKQNFGALVQLDHIETVQVCTLDSVAEQLGLYSNRRIFLKTDTQGHDTEVLRGSVETLKHICGVLTEATVSSIYDGSSTLEELSTLLSSMGFVYGGMFPISYQLKSLALIEMDCFFVR
jgi:FkbM family methyltransferase